MISKSFSMYTAASVVGVLVGAGSQALAEVTFDWATVGNPGNAADPLNSGTIPGIGSVAYEYSIAKHEVTNAQYALRMKYTSSNLCPRPEAVRLCAESLRQ